MSSFNDANELASILVHGRYYSNNDKADQPIRLVFTLTKTVIITAEADTHEEWVKVRTLLTIPQYWDES